MRFDSPTLPNWHKGVTGGCKGESSHDLKGISSCPQSLCQAKWQSFDEPPTLTCLLTPYTFLFILKSFSTISFPTLAPLPCHCTRQNRTTTSNVSGSIGNECYCPFGAPEVGMTHTLINTSGVSMYTLTSIRITTYTSCWQWQRLEYTGVLEKRARGPSLQGSC